MSTMPTTVGRVGRPAILEILLAIALAALVGFVLGFGSQALGSELRAGEATAADQADPGADSPAPAAGRARSRR